MRRIGSRVLHGLLFIAALAGWCPAAQAAHFEPATIGFARLNALVAVSLPNHTPVYDFAADRAVQPVWLDYNPPYQELTHGLAWTQMLASGNGGGAYGYVRVDSTPDYFQVLGKSSAETLYNNQASANGMVEITSSLRLVADAGDVVDASGAVLNQTLTVWYGWNLSELGGAATLTANFETPTGGGGGFMLHSGMHDNVMSGYTELPFIPNSTLLLRVQVSMSSPIATNLPYPLDFVRSTEGLGAIYVSRISNANPIGFLPGSDVPLPVPEPSTGAMLGLGLVSFCLVQWRRRRVHLQPQRHTTASHK